MSHPNPMSHPINLQTEQTESQPATRRILVVDDEEDICTILEFNLAAAGYEVVTASSAEEALALDIRSFDLLLLDVMMGGMSGFEMATRLKADPATAGIPVIFITARDSEDDAVEGLDIGADDYIAKPFSVREVVSRVKAVLRRTAKASSTASGQQPADGLTGKPQGRTGIFIDEEKKSASVDGVPVLLSRNEYEVLRLLLSNKGKVFSREDIIAKVWPDDVVVTDRTVDVCITRLRKKINEYGSRIVSRHGFGYLFEE